MVPTRKGNTIYLKCSKCGYEVKGDESKKYDIRHQVAPSKRVLTAVTSEAEESRLTPEEREMLREYYEVFLEEFERSEEEESESD
jgi:DNA-directed RNA polymerase subunit M